MWSAINKFQNVKIDRTETYTFWKNRILKSSIYLHSIPSLQFRIPRKTE
jgi:hypothetical protein